MTRRPETTRECVRYAPMIGAREGELAAEERAALAAHLEGCAACRARLADQAATEGLVGEGLAQAAAQRDFSAFADQVMARVEAQRASTPAAARVGAQRASTPAAESAAYARHERASPPARPERRPEGPESRGPVRAFLRRHRMAVRFATALAPALAAVALIVYLGRSPDGAPPDVDVTSEIYVPIVISTTDGPMVLLGDGDEPEGS